MGLIDVGTGSVRTVSPWRWIIQFLPSVWKSTKSPEARVPCSTNFTSRVGPLLGLVGAPVPDAHGAGAVLAGRDVAREGGVFEGVVLGVDGQVVPLGVVRQALGQCPGGEHAVALEAQVPVERPGMVLLDHETWGPAPSGAAGAHGLGRLGGIALGPVGAQRLGLFARLAPRGHATTLTQVH